MESASRWGKLSCDDEGRRIGVGVEVLVDDPRFPLRHLERTLLVSWTGMGSRVGAAA